MKNSDKTELGESKILDMDCFANKNDELLCQTLFADLQNTTLNVGTKDKTKRKIRMFITTDLPTLQTLPSKSPVTNNLQYFYFFMFCDCLFKKLVFEVVCLLINRTIHKVYKTIYRVYKTIA